MIIYQPGTIQIKAKASASKNILKNTRILILNKEEAKKFLYSDTTDEKQLLNELLNLGVKEAVITDGKNGSYASDAKEFIKCSIWHSASKLEATGAGDSFAATYSLMRLRDESISDSLKAASINSGSVIQSVGAHKGLLSQSEIDKLMKTIHIKITNI